MELFGKRVVTGMADCRMVGMVELVEMVVVFEQVLQPVVGLFVELE